MKNIKHCFLCLGTILLISACGPLTGQTATEPRQNNLSMDEAFTPYYEEFAYQGRLYTGLTYSAVPVNFAELEYSTKKKGVVGVCYRYSNGRAEIYIDPVFWHSSSEAQRLTLFLHEMGHCSLKREHRNGDNSRGLPISIMNRYVLHPEVFGSSVADYMRELFDPGSISEVATVSEKATRTETTLDEDGLIGCGHEEH